MELSSEGVIKLWISRRRNLRNLIFVVKNSNEIKDKTERTLTLF